MKHLSHAVLVATVALASIWGCASNGSYNGDDWTPGTSSSSGGTNTPGAATEGTSSDGRSDASAPSGPSGLPCDVDGLLKRSCTTGGCHAPGSSAGSLHTRADLMATSVKNGPATVAERSITRMNAKTMPPSAPSPAADVAILQAWVSAGYPAGACGSSAPDASVADPYSTPLVCTSNNTNPPDEGIDMAPGQSCGNCHFFKVGGTVYPTAHEPNDCRGSNGTAVGATVVVTGADGRTKTLPVSSSGNFFGNMFGVITPYTVKVVAGGKVRAMASSTSNGDCNDCHTQNGTMGAPGRIMMPQ